MAKNEKTNVSADAVDWAMDDLERAVSMLFLAETALDPRGHDPEAGLAAARWLVAEANATLDLEMRGHMAHILPIDD